MVMAGRRVRRCLLVRVLLLGRLPRLVRLVGLPVLPVLVRAVGGQRLVLGRLLRRWRQVVRRDRLGLRRDLAVPALWALDRKSVV